MSILHEHVVIGPAWIEGMEMCHIVNKGSQTCLCGEGVGMDDGDPCGTYDGRAICEGCGNPRCPRCVQLAALEDGMA